MRQLREGMKGADVKRVQWFLIGRQAYAGIADGVFGPATTAAVKHFQKHAGLTPQDGIIGNETYAMMSLRGFKLVEDDDPTEAGADWPPKPAGIAPLAGNAARAQLFGKFSYRSAPVAGNPENIRILGDWEERNIVRVHLPQLAEVKGAPDSCQIRFHRLAVKQLQWLWEAWEEAGLLPLVKTWEGSFVPRFVRGSRTTLSNHAFGSAFDINYAWNQLGHVPALVGREGSVRKLALIALKYGFYWGGHFARLDGMHFEVYKILTERPES